MAEHLDLPGQERLWPPPYWVLLFALAMTLSLGLDALVTGHQGEWLSGVFFGVAVMVLFTKPGPAEHPDDKGSRHG